METTKISDDTIYKIKVRQYMTKPSTPEFNFHDKFNHGVQMPLRIMVGRVLEETKGMVKMELWGKPMPSSTCCACGRQLTHPVSLHYGIGPECGQHFHINPYETEEQLEAEYEQLKQKMADIKWTGWIIKSAIEDLSPKPVSKPVAKPVVKPAPVPVQKQSWKDDSINYLYHEGIVSDAKGWIEKEEEAIPVWAATIIIANLFKKVKNVTAPASKDWKQSGIDLLTITNCYLTKKVGQQKSKNTFQYGPLLQ
jgi:hypothetical protein